MIDNKISTILLMEGKTIAQDAIEYAANLIDAHALHPNGNFSLHIELDEGTVGTLDVWYEATNISDTQGAKSGVEAADRFIKPANAAVFEAFGAASGAGADGRDIKDFNIETCYQARIGVKAVGGVVKIKRLIAAVQ